MTGAYTVLPRIGCVKYLNARPLVHGWPGDVLFDHPNRLCSLLAEGGIDIALVSSFEFLRNPIYFVVDKISVSSRGSIYSVFLTYKGDLAEIEEVEVDPASRTSVNLLRCLLAEAGLSPKLVHRSAETDRDVTNTFAKFLIGDHAIRFRQAHASTLQFLDLGEEWKSLTGLPFVFALWLIRPEAKVKEEMAERLRQCRDSNLRNLDSVIAAQREFTSEFCTFYLRECLSYNFGQQEKQGLLMFRTLCEKHGILSQMGRKEAWDFLRPELDELL